MTSQRARPTHRTLLAALLPALLVAACGSGGSPAPRVTSAAGAVAAPSGAGASSPGASGGGPGVSGLLQTGDVAASGAAIPQDVPLADPGEGGVPPYERTTPVAGRLTTGAPTTLATTTIGSAGGTIEAAGLRIEVPKETLAADTAFAVTSAAISAADFGGLVHPVTPLYRIEDGGAAFASPVTVTLQAPIPAGATAMAFYYDEATGTLTPLTPIAQDGTSLTAGATHFSGILGAILDLANVPAIVDSGFRPGIDDWQFDNYGSYVTPAGECEGTSVSEIWYYVTQRLGGVASPLHGLSDNNGAETKTPASWQDDSHGYRLVSSLQHGIEHNGVGVPFTYKFLKNGMWDAADGRLTYVAFRAAIALSGRPQLIRTSTGPGDGGHTMVVYRVTPQWLLIADPNYPGIGRRIRYDPATGSLGPFVSGNNAADIAAGMAQQYTRFAYVPWESSASDTSIWDLWADFEGGTAGNGVFPGYDLLIASGKDADGKDIWVPWTDGYTTTESSVDVQVSALHPGLSPAAMLVYPGTSSVPSTGGRAHVTQTLQLVPGENAFGVAIWGNRAGLGDWEYVDFVRLTINGGPAPTPTPESSATATFGEPVRITIHADVPWGGSGPDTCPAEVTLAFTPSGGDPNGTGAAYAAAGAGLWAICTDTAQQAIDASGTFDGHTFAIPGTGRSGDYTGTFDGHTATIIGKGVNLAFPMP